MLQLNKDNLYSIVVLGCGGTGSQLVPFLMQLYSHCNNIKEVILIDGDIIEPKNTINQKYVLSEEATNKAIAMAERFSIVYPNLNIRYVDDYLTNEEQLTKIVENNPTILVSCVDNNASRKILSSYFNNRTKNDLIYIDSGNGTITRNGQVVIGYKHDNKKVLPCAGDIFTDIQNDTDSIENVGTCMRISQDHPQNIATNILAATVIFTIITNIITFNKIESKLVYFNADTTNVVSR